MANTLVDMIPTLYQALDQVSRDTTGLISAVTVNASETSAAVGESILVPITTENQLFDIVEADEPPNNGDFELKHAEIKITKSKMVPIRWGGEQQLALGNTGTYHKVLADQIYQAMNRLAGEVEYDLASCYVSASRAYGTAGTIPFQSDIVAAAQLRRILMDNGAPMTDLQMVLTSLASSHLRALPHMTHANENGSDATLRQGELLDLMGFKVRESKFLPMHSAGGFTGTPLVNHGGGYAKGTTSIAFDGTTAADIKAGDVVTFGSDPTKYIVAEDCDASPLVIAAPGLVKPIADNATITVGNAYQANLAFSRSAVHLICRDPQMPVIDGKAMDKAADVTHVTDPVSGLTFQIALYKGYHRIRFEVGLAWGCAVLKPEHCALLLG